MGAMAEKCGTHPAMLRSKPAADAAILTGLVRLSPTRTTRCGHCDQLLHPHWEKAFSQWGCKSWSQWPHLVVRVGDSLTSPVNIAASAAGLERTIAGWGPHLSSIAPGLWNS